MDAKNTGDKIMSKYQFVILAAKRARQLLKGAKPKIKTKSRNPIRIAQQEVKMGLVNFETVDLPRPSKEAEREEQVIVVEGRGEELEGIPSLVSLEEEEEEAEAEEERLDRVYEEDEEEEEEEEELEFPEKETDEE